MAAIQRFYQQAACAPKEGGFAVTLDGKQAHTPKRRPLIAPTLAVGEAIAEEFAAQEKTVNPHTMPITRFLTIALDVIADSRAAVADDIAAYGETDALYYRDDTQPPLRQRQETQWNPVLDWARTRYDVSFTPTEGIMPVPQPEATLARFVQAVAGVDDYRLSALAVLVKNLSSLILGLAVLERHLDVQDAIRLSRLEEDFQIEQWGEDEEAKALWAEKRQDILSAARFLHLL